MDRRAHGGDTHDPPSEQELREHVGAKRVQARPERWIGIARDLRLQAYEVHDRVHCGELGAAQEQLPLERRAVQRAAREHLAHSSLTASAPPNRP